MEEIKEFLKMFYVPSFNIGNLVEIFIIIYVIYKLIFALRNTRAWIILKGILILCGFYLIAYVCSFEIIKIVFQSSITICAIAIVVIFQQDLKKILEQIGNKSILQYIKDIKTKAKRTETPKRMTSKTIDELTDALFALSKTKTGSLIVIEKDVPLDDIVATGISVNAEISSALLINIFEKNTPLHDGAVIIKGDKIVSATCYLPLSTNTTISKSLGTRHRAGIGVTEAVDCLVLISSEETGQVSFVENGKITKNVTKEQLKKALLSIQELQQPNLPITPREHLFNNNARLKIFSIILGVLFWFISMSTIDPVTTMVIEDVPITIKNEYVISQINKTYDLGEIETVDVTVKDKNSILKDLTAADLVATVDLSKLSYVNTVDVNVTINNDTTEIKDIEHDVISITLDDVSYGEFPIDIQTTGDPIRGYAVREIVLNKETVIITGAETQIKKIDKVVAELDIENVRDGQNIKFVPVVYDKNGDVINEKKLTFEVKNLSAQVFLEKTKSVPLNINIIEADGSAGQIKDISYDPTEIIVIGTAEELEYINSIDIDIPVKIEISNDNNTKLTKVINIREFIPEDIVLQDEDQKVTITITYAPYPTKTISERTENIQLIGKNNNFEYKFMIDKLEIPVTAHEDILKDLSVNDLIINADVSTITSTGTHDIIINISSEYNVVVDNIEAKIIVTENQD